MYMYLHSGQKNDHIFKTVFEFFM